MCEAFDQEGVKFFHYSPKEISTGAQRGRRLIFDGTSVNFCVLDC